MCAWHPHDSTVPKSLCCPGDLGWRTGREGAGRLTKGKGGGGCFFFGPQCYITFCSLLHDPIPSATGAPSR